LAFDKPNERLIPILRVEIYEFYQTPLWQSQFLHTLFNFYFTSLPKSCCFNLQNVINIETVSEVNDFIEFIGILLKKQAKMMASDFIIIRSI